MAGAASGRAVSSDPLQPAASSTAHHTADLDMSAPCITRERVGRRQLHWPPIVIPRASGGTRIAELCSMRNSLPLLLILAACSSPRHPSGRAAPTGRKGGADPARRVEHRAANPHATVAYRWIDIMLEATGREVDRVGARPTIISRQMAIAVTAMYDAWAAYDARAVG